MEEALMEELKAMYPEVEVERLKKHYGVECGD